jgi:hypothetical protein
MFAVGSNWPGKAKPKPECPVEVVRQTTCLTPVAGNRLLR